MATQKVTVKFFKSDNLLDEQHPGDSLEAKIGVFLATIAPADFIDIRFMAADQGWNFAYVLYKS